MAAKSFKSLITEKRINKAYEKLISDDDIAVEDGQFVIIRSERYTETLKIMADHFNTDEPLCRSVGVVWDHEFEDFVMNTLKQNMSIALVSPGGEIIGLRLLGVNSKTDSNDISNLKNAEFLKVKKILRYLDSKIDVYRHYGVEDIIHFLTLAVRRDFRQRGIGGKVMAAAIRFVKHLDLGGVVIKGEGTSKFSQRIYEKLGFETLAELIYDDYKVDGEVVFKNMGVHTSGKIHCKVV